MSHISIFYFVTCVIFVCLASADLKVPEKEKLEETNNFLHLGIQPDHFAFPVNYWRTLLPLNGALNKSVDPFDNPKSAYTRFQDPLIPRIMRVDLTSRVQIKYFDKGSKIHAYLNDQKLWIPVDPWQNTFMDNKTHIFTLHDGYLEMNGIFYTQSTIDIHYIRLHREGPRWYALGAEYNRETYKVHRVPSSFEKYLLHDEKNWPITIGMIRPEIPHIVMTQHQLDMNDIIECIEHFTLNPYITVTKFLQKTLYWWYCEVSTSIDPYHWTYRL